MLPSSSRYLLKGGIPEQTAGCIMMGAFIAGFIGIQAISRVLHRFMPSHVVDCDHTHDEEALDAPLSRDHSRRPTAARRMSRPDGVSVVKIAPITEDLTESTPLLPASEPQQAVQNGRPEFPPRNAWIQSDSAVPRAAVRDDTVDPLFPPMSKSRSRISTAATLRRPSMVQVRDRVMSFVKDTKSNCDLNGPCYGYSDPCGQECFKHLSSRSSVSHQHRLPRFLRTTTSSHIHSHPAPVFGAVPEHDESGSASSCVSPTFRTSRAASRDSILSGGSGPWPPHDPHDHDEMDRGPDPLAASYDDADAPYDADATSPSDGASVLSADKEPHHHHVPTNAFLAIGLQTVMAIALHKFPEGFITYATNHANPALGFNVFMALFVHNIAEGFTMALPLYMALGSRVAAVAWASLLGGLTQPLGAGFAAAWFALAGSGGSPGLAVDPVAYACLFAATAGIMTSVALQLFVESLSLDHNRNLSIAFAFLGMTLLGVSNAFFDH